MVLIIEDDLAIRSGLEYFLKEEGFNVITKENGISGIECINNDIELVLYYETDNNKLAIKNLKYWCEFLPKCIVKKEALSQKAIIKTVIKKIIGQKCTSLLKKFLARRIKASKNISVVSSTQKAFYLAPAYEFRNDFMKDANICKFQRMNGFQK